VWQQELTIEGINAHGMEDYRGRKVSSFDMAIDMINRKKIRLDGFVTHRFRLDDYKRAFKLVKEKSADVIKAVFEIS